MADRDAWFKRAYGWLPPTCGEGHELGVGKISLHRVTCTCPASVDGLGHHLVSCRVNGCRAPFLAPPGCPREWPK